MLVLREGRVVQSGAPKDVLAQPANVEVARLLALRICFSRDRRARSGKEYEPLKLGDFELIGPYYPGRFLRDRVCSAFARGSARAEAERSSPRGEPRASQAVARL